MAKREFAIAIDELTYLKLDEIVNIKNKSRVVQKKTADVLLLLFSKAIKEYVLDNEGLVHDKLANDLFELDCRIEGKGFDVSHIFDESPTSAKEGE